MLGRKARPVIGNLITGTSASRGYKPGVYDIIITSPKSPLEFIKIQSPRGALKSKYAGVGGVGLGIVAALENSCIQTHALYNQTCCNISVPISVSSSTTRNKGNTDESDDGDSLEDYTYVTSYGPNSKKSHTRVYYDACHNSRYGSDRKSSKSHKGCVFYISPVNDSPPVSSDFLSSCHMCQKKLHGEDIYMYRGEKAYCSTECRERQIVMDEKKEKKWSSSRSSDLSTSPNCNTNDHHMFTTGIFAI